MRSKDIKLIFIVLITINVIQGYRTSIPNLDSTQRVMLEAKIKNSIKHMLNPDEEPITNIDKSINNTRSYINIHAEVLNKDETAYSLYLEQQEEDKFKMDLEEQNMKFLNLLESEAYLILLQKRLEKLLKKQKETAKTDIYDELFFQEYNKHMLLFNLRNKKLVELEKEHDAISREFYKNLSILIID